MLKATQKLLFQIYHHWLNYPCQAQNSRTMKMCYWAWMEMGSNIVKGAVSKDGGMQIFIDAVTWIP